MHLCITKPSREAGGGGVLGEILTGKIRPGCGNPVISLTVDIYMAILQYIINLIPIYYMYPIYPEVKETFKTS